jgi:hypothetical protein
MGFEGQLPKLLAFLDLVARLWINVTLHTLTKPLGSG